MLCPATANAVKTDDEILDILDMVMNFQKANAVIWPNSHKNLTAERIGIYSVEFDAIMKWQPDVS